MRLPGLILLLMLWGGSRCVEASQPINLFRPDTGQRTLFEERDGFGRGVFDTISFWITAKSGDTASYRVLHLKTRRTAIRTFAWDMDKLTDRVLLKSGTLDTSGIYSKVKNFPADFTSRTATNASRSGYTLRHVVDGFLFDTLLVSCAYLSTSDEGDNCDFITPSGVLVYSSVEGCMCVPSTSFRYMPDAETLAAMGGRPVPNLVLRKTRRKAVTAVPLIRPTDGFDIRGRWTTAPSAALSLPGTGN